MPKIEKSIEIKRPPEEIWPRTSLDKLPEWIDFIKKAEWTSERKDETDATARMTIQVWDTKVESGVDMTEVVKNQRRAWLAADENMTTAGLMIFSPTEAGTKLTVVMNYDFPKKSEFGRLMRTMFAIFGRQISKDIEKGLKKLKDTLEKRAIPNL